MNQPPTFSVVIATYGRPVKLKRCLEGIGRIAYPRDQLEVIVVDDGSPVKVRRAIGDGLSGGVDVKFLRQKNLGPGIARNAGVRAARGRWIAFIDDDCIPHRRWLSELERVLTEKPRSMVGGKVLNGYPRRLFDTASWALLDYLYANMRETPDSQRFFATMNVGVARDEFLAMGGFDEGHSFLAEDRDLCERWLASGRELLEVPTAVIKHYHGLTLRGFMGQHMKYGRGARRFHIARAARRARPVKLEPASFYLGLLFSPFRLPLPLHRKLALTVCMILSQGAMVVGYYWDKVSSPYYGTDLTSNRHD